MSPTGVPAGSLSSVPAAAGTESGPVDAAVRVEDGPAPASVDTLQAELAAARQELAGLRAALLSRATIDQARGILIARYQISADGAFELLVRWSQDRNIKLRLIAETLVTLVQHGGEVPGIDRPLARWLTDQLAEPSPEE